MNSEPIPNDEDEQNNITETFSLSFHKNNKKQKILYIFIVSLIIIVIFGLSTFFIRKYDKNKKIQPVKQQPQKGQQQRQQQTYKKQQKQPGQQQVDKKSFKRVYGPLRYTDKNSSPDHQTSPTTKILQQKYKKQTGTQRGTLKQQSGKKQIEEPTNTTEL